MRRLKDKAASGQEVTPFDTINTVKQVVDDKISKLYRDGENNQARDLVMLKNKFLDIADENIPAYKQARNLFAGKAQLEDAAKNGEMILKMPSSDVDELVKGLSKSEKAMYVLGAKKAIFDQIDNTKTGGDAYARIFGKNGDITKMQALFDTPEAFNQVKNDIERSSIFKRTKAQFEGSPTATRLAADESQGIPSISIADIAKKQLLGVTKSKDEKAAQLAYQKIGDLLSKENLSLDDLTGFLNKQTKEENATPMLQRAKSKAAKIGTISTIATESNK
jgi:hypothetical protein